MIYAPLTKLQCSPTADGSAAAILASERFVDEHDLWDRAVEIVGQSMVTDMSSSFEDRSAISVVGGKMTARAAAGGYQQAGARPRPSARAEAPPRIPAHQPLPPPGPPTC